MKDTQSLGLFVSKQPHALIQILNKQEAGFFPKTDIGFIVSNSKASEKIAQRHDIPFYFISTKGDHKDFEAKQLEIIKRYQPSCIGLARYMKVLSEDFLSELNCPIVNIHHSYRCDLAFCYARTRSRSDHRTRRDTCTQRNEH